ncbi:AraC family transcriptional regulator [Pseudomonas tolaasii]|uniref:AraC family transcriptional regulator n=1 Tax=Pseudomonas tolaasii TaxID=29442 RepID=UPI000364FCE2|nr:helix-turn-helix transcriptional regulator [Pseudomonas tolaasii]
MPILSDAEADADNANKGWVEPDDVPRPVVVYGYLSKNLERTETDFHRHRKSQLMLLMHGTLSCELEDGLWIVPPHNALWIPGDVLHNVTVANAIEGYSAFIEPSLARNLPSKCCSITVPPLLRALLLRAASYPLLYREGAMESQVMALLLEEIATLPTGDLHLPMPQDAKLRTLAQMIMKNPADRGTVEVWARRAGMSERSLARNLRLETDMSFGRWRQQIHLMLAVKWLGAGASVQQVAEDLGYESASSFVTMFGKALGTSPKRYMMQRAAAGDEHL